MMKNYLPLKKVFPEMKLIVVDDGSIEMPAYDTVKFYDDSDIHLYKVEKDYGFNSHGARNLAMHVTDSDWNILLDLDVNICSDFVGNLKELVSDDLDNSTIYYFADSNEVRGHVVPSLRLINHFLIHKDLFWSVNGYDEEYVGYWCGDGEFAESVGAVGKINYVTTLKIHISDIRNVKPKENLNREQFLEIENKVRSRIANREFWRKTPMNFKWNRQL